MRRLLGFLSPVYRLGVLLRNKAYDANILPVSKVPAVVISVGNIVAGGVGKTPLVHLLASELASEFKVAILSRGYKSDAEFRKEPTLVDPKMEAEEVGDEPLWLARKLPGVEVWVGHDRIKSAEIATERGAQILILDDGFQHRRLHRDFDIVVTSKPTGSEFFLPRGNLRDLPERLMQATLIAVMGDERLTIDIPQVVFKRKISLRLDGKKVAVFCAIGNPERFIQQVQAMGATLTISSIKPDHEPFSLEELEMLLSQSKAELLVCTEKDFIKLPTNSMPITPIPLELSIADGDDLWHNLINQIKSKVQNVNRDPSYAS